MPENDNADLQESLRETAAEFVKLRGALQQAGSLAVASSPLQRARLAALNKRADAIQKTIEGTGRIIDGARRWFADTFGALVESAVPLANPAIAVSVRSSIAAMKFFMRDAKAELDRIVARQKQFEALPDDAKKSALAGLAAETVPNERAVIAPMWLKVGAGILVAYLFLSGETNENH